MILKWDEEVFLVTTEPNDLFTVKEALTTKGVVCEESSLEMIPKTTVNVARGGFKANWALIEWLEGLEDVDAVYHNMG